MPLNAATAVNMNTMALRGRPASGRPLPVTWSLGHSWALAAAGDHELPRLPGDRVGLYRPWRLLEHRRPVTPPQQFRRQREGARQRDDERGQIGNRLDQEHDDPGNTIRTPGLVSRGMR